MNGRVLIFLIDGVYFGIDVSLIKEINNNIIYSYVPKADEEIVGLFNMRGQVVTILDIYKLIFKNKSYNYKSGNSIILKAIDNTEYIGFLVEDTEEVYEITDEICEKPQFNIEYSNLKNISEIAKIDNKLVLIIDSENIFK